MLKLSRRGAVGFIVWLDCIAWQNLKCLKEHAVLPAMCLAISLAQVNDVWFVRSASEHRPNLADTVNLAGRFASVIANNNVFEQPHAVARASAARIVSNRILSNEHPVVFLLPRRGHAV